MDTLYSYGINTDYNSIKTNRRYNKLLYLIFKRKEEKTKGENIFQYLKIYEQMSNSLYVEDCENEMRNKDACSGRDEG